MEGFHRERLETMKAMQAVFTDLAVDAYALGKPTTFESPEDGEVKRTLIVRWLPPDPNDRSNYIEPEPD